MKKIYFDEAGYTGNNLLDKDQPIFCYLGLISSDEIEKEFIDLRKKYGYADQEVKGNSLCKSGRGQKFIKSLWETFKGNVKFVYHDKKFALSAKIYEYTYESVFQEISSLLYRSNFHRFIALLFYSYLIKSDKTAESIFNNFSIFVKNKDNNGKLNLLGYTPQKNSPLEAFYKFCKNNKEEIACDVDFSDSASQWLLDLTNTSLYSLLVKFAGNSNEEILAFCDDSKPLLTQLEFINTFVDDKRILYNDTFGFKMRFNFNLASPIKLIDSKTCVSIQLADCLVSSIYYSLLNQDYDFCKEIIEISTVSFDADHSIAPSGKNTHFSEDEKILNFSLLKELSRRTKKDKKLDIIRHYSFLVQLLHFNGRNEIIENIE